MYVCNSAVLMVWVGLGTTNTWLSFGKEHVLVTLDTVASHLQLLIIPITVSACKNGFRYLLDLDRTRVRAMATSEKLGRNSACVQGCVTAASCNSCSFRTIF